MRSASVREWLAAEGLSQYASLFEENRMGLDVLSDLHDQDLQISAFRWAIGSGCSRRFAPLCNPHRSKASRVAAIHQLPGKPSVVNSPSCFVTWSVRPRSPNG